MDQTFFENLLARYCAPTLAGIKPANLVSLVKKQEHSMINVQALLSQYNHYFITKGIRFTVLCQCNGRILLLVYRQRELTDFQKKNAVAEFLQQYGYHKDDTLEDKLKLLGNKIETGGGFPHEIGLFLGYPLEDVEGFIRCKGQNFLCNGYWKVYARPEEKQKLFCRYAQCCAAVCRQVQCGKTISQMFLAS